MFYLIQNQTVVHKTESKKLRQHAGEYIESEEDWPLGSSYIDGVFGEPVKTYDEELAELNASLISDLEGLEKKITKAKAWDGASEGPKVEALRAQKTPIQTQYLADLSALKTKWGK